ncbi:hypothetical protein CRG98_008355 [Punica granatum]|uniref:Uncharacterized protein n=1 Tax=Punica granatum TaxID=22663 RepID=A0A2I0KS02_PUNGR|nr:hypothetical protein CRG98_008355 [Punica granatum]
MTRKKFKKADEGKNQQVGVVGPNGTMEGTGEEAQGPIDESIVTGGAPVVPIGSLCLEVGRRSL